MEINSKDIGTINTEDENGVKVDQNDITMTYECDVTTMKKTTITNKYRYKWYHVNMKMVPSKMAYFFEMARRLGFAPNLVLFLINIGLNKAESGFIVGLRLVNALYW